MQVPIFTHTHTNTHCMLCTVDCVSYTGQDGQPRILLQEASGFVYVGFWIGLLSTVGGSESGFLDQVPISLGLTRP